ncbi:MAG: sulfurtransferase TusA family protein [Candidatus Methanoperedens sp.]|nr:sulfurtransferase TusA family protein [Candidatus Methanoperedens sp.]
MNEEESPKPDRFLDCIGLFCPIPIFNTTQEMEKIEKGEVLEMVTDDPLSFPDKERITTLAHGLKDILTTGVERKVQPGI